MIKYIFVIVVAPAAVITTLFFGAPEALADPTDTAVANNPGLQQSCAFNPAFLKGHASACDGITVESTASNGGNEEFAPAPPA